MNCERPPTTAPYTYEAFRAEQEKLIAEYDVKIEASSADYQELTRLLQEKADAEAKLEELMEQWETLSLEMEG